MNILEFLKARLDEDEAPVETVAHVHYCPVSTEQVDVSECYGAEAGCGPFTATPGLRILREVEAKRTIILEEMHHVDGWEANYCYSCHDIPESCRILRILASIWSDHPDYEQEWA